MAIPASGILSVGTNDVTVCEGGQRTEITTKLRPAYFVARRTLTSITVAVAEN